MSNPDPGTLNDVLEICRPTITPALIDAPSLARLAAVCARLPKSFSTFWGVEAALGNPRAEVDLLVEVKRGSPRHGLIAGLAPSKLDELCERVPAWIELRRFARAWADRDDARAALVRNVWVEFDLIAAAGANPPFDALERPSVFWGPEDIGGDGWPRFLTLVELVRDSFAPFPRVLPLDTIERAVRHLPPGARIFQLGAMQTRGEVMLRLCINHLARKDVPAWLQAQGWQGDAEALGAALLAISPLVRVVAIDVDYTAAGIGPKIGVECYLQWTDTDPAQWQPLLDHVSALGLCVGAKRAAIAAFPAKTEFSVKGWLQQPEDGAMFPVVFQNIHHVKVSFLDGAFREAKAYLGIARPGVKIGSPFRPVPEGESDEWLST